jgi:hypothetical protein
VCGDNPEMALETDCALVAAASEPLLEAVYTPELVPQENV